MDIRPAIRGGLLTGFVNVFMVLLGLTGLAGTILRGWFKFNSLAPGAWVLLLAIALWGGSMAVREIKSQSWRQTLLAGLVAGLFHGLVMAAFTGIVGALVSPGADLRQWLAQLSNDAVRLLTFGRAPIVAAAVMFAAQTAAGLAGALLVHASTHYRWGELARKQWAAIGTKVSSVATVQAARKYRHTQRILYGVGILILLVSPLVLGQYWNYTLGTVGVYVILGIGLNIVVGMAGLLDLGYAAFFAIGAYTVALLTAPTPHGIGMNFWLVLPIGVALAAVSGVLLGIPVLRMRGDYLAIVTLGFGEIIRILSKSDALTNFTGGPRGVRAVGGPTLFGNSLNSELHFMYFIVLGIVLAILITFRLQNSRVGRAWMAMRDDEDVAQAMGIYTLKYKLLAFAVGAAFAGFSGVIFASRNQFTGPEDFTLLVSINVLCLVIVGGMGSIPGVVMGSLALKGLPEILRQLSDFRMLAFGALLVVMMILRPEGIWPSKRKQMELHESEE